MSDKNFKVKNGIDAVGPITISPLSNATNGLIINTLAGGRAITFNRESSNVGSIDDWGVYSGSGVNIVQPWTARSPGLESQSFFWVGSGARSVAGFAGTNSGTNPVIYIAQIGTATNDLTQWVKPDNTVLAKVDYLGNITANDLTLAGNLTVNGTTTNLNSTNLIIEDKNIIIADITTPTDTTADGAGITIKGATDKTLNWVQSTGSFISSDPFIINTTSTTKQNLIIKGVSSQTANLQEWRNVSEVVVANIGVSSASFMGTSASTIYPIGINAAPNANAFLTIGSTGWVSFNTASPVFGIYTRQANTGTGDIIGIYSQPVTANATGHGSVTSIASAIRSAGGAGSVTNYAYNFYANSPTMSSGTITNLYGLYINTQKATSVTNPYGIYQAGVDDLNYLNGRTTIQSGNTGYVPLIVKGIASQTANLQQWQDSAGNLVAWTGFDGRTYLAYSMIGTWNLDAMQTIYSNSASRIGQVIRGATSQTANLQEWQDSAGTVLAKVDANGGIKITPNNAATVNLLLTPGSGQYGNMFEWQNGSGTTFGKIDANGHFYLQNSRGFFINSSYTGSSTFVVSPQTASATGILIKGATSQTANLQEWQDSSGTVLTKIDSSGKITSTASDHYFGSSTAYRPNIHITNTTADSNGSYILFEKSRAGSAVVANDVLGVLNFTGFDTATYAGSAIIYGVAEGTFSPTSRPGKLVFATVPSGSTTMTDRMTIANSGTVTVNGFAAGSQGLIVKAAASQTADLQQWQDSGGTALAGIGPNGRIYAQGKTGSTDDLLYVRRADNNVYLYVDKDAVLRGNFGIALNQNAPIDTQVYFYSGTGTRSAVGVSGTSSTNPTFYVKAASSQTSSLTEWQNSSGTVVAKVFPEGYIQSPIIYSSIFDAPGSTGTLLTLSTSGASSFTTRNAAHSGLIVKGFASQTANLQEWQNSSGTVLASIGPNGTVYMGSNNSANIATFYNGTSGYGAGSISSAGTFNIVGANIGFPYTSSGAVVTVNATNATTVPLTARGYTSQTANLQEWQNSSGAAVVNISSGGDLIIPGSRMVVGAGTPLSQIMIGAVAAGAAFVPIVAKGAASQTADLFQIQDSGGAVRAAFERGGALSVVPSTALNGYTGFFKNPSASVIGIIVRGATSQSASLQEWQNSASTVIAKIDASGNFSAISKSFDIEHPTKENMRLRYASLEGPENGVYIRGTTDSRIIELPDYWTGLVHEDSITVSLTSVGSAQNIYVEKIENNKIYIGGNLEKAFFTVYGERKDIDKLTVEY